MFHQVLGNFFGFHTAEIYRQPGAREIGFRHGRFVGNSLRRYATNEKFVALTLPLPPSTVNCAIFFAADFVLLPSAS